LKFWKHCRGKKNYLYFRYIIFTFKSFIFL